MDIHKLETLPLLLMLTMLAELFVNIQSQFVSPSCQQTIWDSTATGPGVHHVFLHCVEGHLTWRYPYGAVRVTLQLGQRNRPFEACFIAQSFSTAAKVSLESILDGEQVLEPLTHLGTHNPRTPREICVTSPSGDPVTLYLESDTDQESRTFGQVELEYDLQRTLKRLMPDEEDMEDCRPCTDEELMYAVCTSDFAVAGSIHRVFHNSAAAETEVHLQVNKILHQQQPHFKLHESSSSSTSSNSKLSSQSHPRLTRGRHRKGSRGEESLTFTPDEEGQNTLLDSVNAETDSRVKAVPRTDSSSESGGVVIAPHKCKIRPSRHGSQDAFLFMGKIRLQRARLQCAPRVEDFERIWENALRDGTNPCILE